MTEGNKGLLEVTSSYRGSKVLQKVTRSYRRLQRGARGYWGLKVVTWGYKR